MSFQVQTVSQRSNGFAPTYVEPFGQGPVVRKRVAKGTVHPVAERHADHAEP